MAVDMAVYVTLKKQRDELTEQIRELGAKLGFMDPEKERILDAVRNLETEVTDDCTWAGVLAAELLVCQPEDVEGYLHPAKEYRIPYVSGETLKYREFTTKAASKEDAIADLYRKEGDFDHRILAVYENGVLIDEEVDG